jgi:hypothetical protein
MQRRREAFQVVFVIAAALVLPAAITLRSVIHPGTLDVAAANPTPRGYTWSLLLFVVPIIVLVWWFARRRDLQFPRKAFWRTIAVLAPLGFVLDLLFGNAFFTFPNHEATIGVNVPAVGGPIPVEEFVFYLTGFMLVLLSYIWCDEYWMAAYNVPDYKEEARDIPRIARFRPQTLIGLNIGAWSNLPIEEPCVWMAVTFTTIIVYEVIKIWKALGTRALEAFFGIRKEQTR